MLPGQRRELQRHGMMGWARLEGVAKGRSGSSSSSGEQGRSGDGPHWGGEVKLYGVGRRRMGQGQPVSCAWQRIGFKMHAHFEMFFPT